MAQVVELAYRADISQLVQNLGKIPGVTEKEAKAMVKSLDRQMKKAEASSKRAAQGTQKAWSKAGGPLKSFEKDAGRSAQVIRGLGGARAHFTSGAHFPSQSSAAALSCSCLPAFVCRAT